VGFRESLLASSKKHSSRVVIGLDLKGPPETRVSRGAALARLLGEELAAVKIQYHLILPGGVSGLAELVRVCSEFGLPVIADLKLNDIESTNLEAVDLLFSGGVDAVIANPFVGAEEGLSGVIAEGKRRGKGVILLVHMSHAGAREGYGLVVGGEPLYVEFARRVRNWDADGAIVSAKSLPVIRQVRAILKPEQLILSPGVGAQGGVADRSLLEAGTDFAIVGRSIVDSSDPLAALRSLNAALAGP
jgi:orotidine-5'-phosphate decarboxylase